MVTAQPHATPQRVRSPHVAYLDGLRALAALFVLIGHCDVVFNVQDVPNYLHPLRDIFVLGHEAVDVFIVLSGFCLMMPLVRRGDQGFRAVDFYKRRARRILPTYYAALLFSMVMDQFALHERYSLHAVLTHVFLIHDMSWSDDVQINAVFWSIAVEVHIYLLFPLLVTLWRRLGPFAATALAVAVGWLLQLALAPTPIFTGANGTSVWFLGLFALGALAAGIAFAKDGALKSVVQKVTPNLGWIALALIAAGAGLTRFSPCFGHSLYPITDLIVGLGAACLLVHASRPTFAGRLLSLKPLAFLGTFAYSIYLIHLPLLMAFQKYVCAPHHLSPTVNMIVMWVVAAPLCVALAYLFHLAFERPFMSKHAPRSERQAEVAAAINPAP